jgi:hypothetical protein
MLGIIRPISRRLNVPWTSARCISLINWPAERRSGPSRKPWQCERRTFAISGTSSEESKRIVKLALAGNMAITMAKAACWMSTGSSAMLSETVHSLVDSGNQALLLVGLRRAESAADHRHPCNFKCRILYHLCVVCY